MGHQGKFGVYYAKLAERFYRALEWRYNDIQDEKGMEREGEILAKMLDTLLADQIAHDLELGRLEEAMRQFQKIRLDSFTPKKYAGLLELMNLDEGETAGYKPMLYGAVIMEHQAHL